MPLQRSLKNAARRVLPPILVDGIRSIRRRILPPPAAAAATARPGDEQDLDVYWDPAFAEVLETWGQKTVWKEIQYLMVNCKGKVLDIACGTGTVIEILQRFPMLEVHGCDISQLLIGKAIDRGIPRDRVMVCDSTQMMYAPKTFDHAYSIGSLEHFTEAGISAFLDECRRVTRSTSFHMIPVSSSGIDEGWISTVQSFHNNSVEWWLPKFRSAYETVYVIDSTWIGTHSVGKWFVCMPAEMD